MNTVDLEHLKEKEDAQSKSLIAGRESFSSSSTGSFYAFGIRISNIDSEIEKELKKSV